MHSENYISPLRKPAIWIALSVPMGRFLPYFVKYAVGAATMERVLRHMAS